MNRCDRAGQVAAPDRLGQVRALNREEQLGARDRVGLGWRGPLAASIYTHLESIDVIEIIVDDCFHAPQRVLRSFRSLARDVPLTCHGVTLGLASVVPVAIRRLERLARVLEVIRPAAWSEHLAFVRGGGYEIGHLAAPPRNVGTVEGALENLARIRRVVGELPMLENIATLIEPPHSQLAEPDWVAAIASGSGGGLLLDLHNLYANAVNAGRDPLEDLRRFPLQAVRQVHLSGGVWMEHRWDQHGVAARRLLDDHLHDVPEVVYTMLADLAERCPQALDVIIERDGRYPEFGSLVDQMRLAREALARGRDRQALGVVMGSGKLPLMRAAWPSPTTQRRCARHSPQFEAFLARLYSEDAFLHRFLDSPEAALTDIGLDLREQAAASQIDRTGLLFAARSYDLKRRSRSRRAHHQVRVAVDWWRGVFATVRDTLSF